MFPGYWEVAFVSVSAWLHLGGRHLGLPDRGRRSRGRPHPVDLGHALRQAGRDRRRQHRRGRLRPLPWLRDGDTEILAGPPDLLGVNYYASYAVRATAGRVPLEIVPPPGYPVTASGWAVAPDGLTETLRALRDRYGAALPPVVISENGCACDDIVDAGACHDPDRIGYLDAHVQAVRQALADGIDVRGFYVWSLPDNFEWAAGYAKRFGLVHVDYPTQARTPKSSYHRYQNLIRTVG
jgi:beta-glucosidase